jgi:hypothetical protein
MAPVEQYDNLSVFGDYEFGSGFGVLLQDMFGQCGGSDYSGVFA